MKDRSTLWIRSLLVACFIAPVAAAAEREDQRFLFTYSSQITDVPEGASNIDLWMPVPVDCQGQQVRGVEIISPADGSIAVEGKYGNRIFHKRFAAPLDGSKKLGAELAFDVVRQEIVVPEAKSLANSKRVKPPEDLNVYLTSTRLIPIDGRIAKMAIDLDLPRHDPIRTGKRKAVNLSLDTGIVDFAREQGINLSQVSEAALREAAKQARDKRWIEENRTKMEGWNAWFEAHGMPFEELRVWPWRD